MPSPAFGPLVSTAWLGAERGAPDLLGVDASWYLPAMNRDPRKEYLEAHIPGAIFWDLDALSDLGSPLPHMLPDAETFARSVGQLGISNDDRIVVYDGSGTNLRAPRVWWMFRVFGHDQVAVRDGGFQKWAAESRPVAAGLETRAPVRFEARFRPELVRDRSQVQAASESGAVQLLDARSAGRFAGTEPEPRPGLASGHVPGAKNLPYGELTGPDGRMLSPVELERRFTDAGIDLDRPVITSCGSGVSACVLALGLELVGHRRYAVYDGSWAEWGRDGKVETGPANSSRSG
jgi:thiosulfate/3-mercaptopyruvate sulfurtransferase